MKKILLAFAFFFLLVQGTEAKAAEEGTAMAKETQIRILFNGKEALVTLFDNPVARDFISMLPATVTFEDYARTEKVFYPPRKLNTQGGQTGADVQGDFCYYAPWGNIAVFYKGFGHGGSLYILGRILSGKQELGAQSGTFTATIEVVQ